jgi:hypothetical protein
MFPWLFRELKNQFAPGRLAFTDESRTMCKMF